ncbi:ARHGAP5 [Mytilus edulis]|uniref:ARHGAP5 n=1 Tax=Mytilus edulis TaxID=6550 RepID=A0A8S3S8T2_MYTED|nr:ARHGAP5 [Mytilus edulis]
MLDFEHYFDCFSVRPSRQNISFDCFTVLDLPVRTLVCDSVRPSLLDLPVRTLVCDCFTVLDLPVRTLVCDCFTVLDLPVRTLVCDCFTVLDLPVRTLVCDCFTVLDLPVLDRKKAKELQKKQKKLHKKSDGRPGTSESGCRLVDFQMSSTNPSLPQYVETCVEFIREEGINAEGIYRIPGNKQQVEILQVKLQEDPNVDIRSLDIQVNTVATVLKSFFKDTEPLIPPQLQEELLEAAEKYVENREAGKEPEIPEKSTRLLGIRGVLRKISPVNYEVLKYFITHLNELSQHKDKHSMDSRNLALCLWPTILRMDFSSYDKMAQSTKIPGEVIQTLIDQCGFFFHGEPEC